MQVQIVSVHVFDTSIVATLCEDSSHRTALQPCFTHSYTGSSLNVIVPNLCSSCITYCCRETGSMAELEQLRVKYDSSEAARRDLEKRVKDSSTMQKRLITACTVG